MCSISELHSFEQAPWTVDRAVTDAIPTRRDALDIAAETSVLSWVTRTFREAERVASWYRKRLEHLHASSFTANEVASFLDRKSFIINTVLAQADDVNILYYNPFATTILDLLPMQTMEDRARQRLRATPITTKTRQQKKWYEPHSIQLTQKYRSKCPMIRMRVINADYSQDSPTKKNDLNHIQYN